MDTPDPQTPCVREQRLIMAETLASSSEELWQARHQREDNVKVPGKSAIAAIVVCAVAMAGCSNGEETFDVDLSQEKVALRDDLQEAARRIDEELNRIEQNIANAPEDAGEELRAEKMRLEQLQTQVNQTLDAVDEQSVETWLDFKGDVEEIIDSVDTAVG